MAAIFLNCTNYSGNLPAGNASTLQAAPRCRSSREFRCRNDGFHLVALGEEGDHLAHAGPMPKIWLRRTFAPPSAFLDITYIEGEVELQHVYSRHAKHAPLRRLDELFQQR